MRKGITPVIAVILLLLITISMVGFAFVWFSRITQSALAATENRTQTILSQQEQTIRVDNVNAAARQVTIRATGSQSISNSNLKVYVSSILQACAWDAPTLTPGSTITCTFTSACNPGNPLRVTAPGGPDETTC